MIAGLLAQDLFSERFRAASVACGLAASLIGLTAFAGWVLGNEHLQGSVFAGINMKTNTSLCVTLLGALVVLLGLGERAERWVPAGAGRIPAGVVLGIGAATLFEHLSGVNLGIDELLFDEAAGAVATESPNRMGPMACVCFSLLGLARLLIDRRWGEERAPFQYLALIVTLITSVPLLGYLYDARALYSVGKLTAIALPTALALWLVSVGMLMAQPEVGLMRRLVAQDSGAILLRRLLPAAILVPALIMLLRLWGQDLGLFDQVVGRALEVIAFSLVFLTVIWRTGDVVFRQAVNAARAERSLHEQVVRSLDALADADRRKTEFLAVLAHELRNPLAPVRNAVHLLRARAGVHSEATEPHAVIERQVEHLARLIDDLMDVNRISRDTLELRKGPARLSEIVTGALEASRYLLEAHQHRVSVQLPEQEVQLDADAARLVQVLTNLLTNAARYTPAGGEISLGARLEPRAGAGSAEEHELTLSVRDNGIGIESEQLARVFDMFYQVGRRQGGLGIGLALVRKLVELHGGSVVATSDGSGLGSTFTLRLPRALPLPVPPAPASLAAPALPALQRLNVLVVEDNRDSAEMLGELLELAGAQVQLAHDGESALSLAAQFEPQVILLDIGLPGISGYDVARQVRSSGWGARARIVALTGWGNADDRVRSRDAGIDRHLVKPVQPSALMALLAELHDLHGEGRPPAAGTSAPGLERA
ncbi:MAG TPA: ATP-binding protein [Polyangiaceae bacterium]|nr:ATP-binding protein [Polyangiaceae bacterium]